MADQRCDPDLAVRRLERELTDLRAKLTASEAGAAAMNTALHAVLGQQHVLTDAFGFIRRWVDDPALKPGDECARVEERIARWHKSLVDATSSDAGRPLLAVVDAARVARDVLHAAPELNMSNYDHDDVGLLNTASNEAFGILDTALDATEEQIETPDLHGERPCATLERESAAQGASQPTPGQSGAGVTHNPNEPCADVEPRWYPCASTCAETGFCTRPGRLCHECEPEPGPTEDAEPAPATDPTPLDCPSTRGACCPIEAERDKLKRQLIETQQQAASCTVAAEVRYLRRENSVQAERIKQLRHALSETTAALCEDCADHDPVWVDESGEDRHGPGGLDSWSCGAWFVRIALAEDAGKAGVKP